MREVEYLIIGQGIAGSVLAYQLEKRNSSFCIIDKGHQDSASYVAAGVINPLVLKRMTMSWRAVSFLDQLHDFYPLFDQHFGMKSFYPQPLHKLIRSKEEENFWKKRWKLAELDDFAELELSPVKSAHFKEGFKKGEVKHTAWVDLKTLLPKVREYYLKKDMLLDEALEYLELENLRYKDILFEKVIFCEGAGCSKNPFFNHLPFQYNKGELLTIKAPGLGVKELYKKKIFIVPLGDDLYRIGATYEKHHETKYDPKLKREELIENFESIFDCDFEVIEQESGIRPTVKDRRPLIGRHPLLSNFYILNGLGSRGCMMAPLLSEELMAFIEDGKDLPEEADLGRT